MTNTERKERKAVENNNKYIRNWIEPERRCEESIGDPTTVYCCAAGCTACIGIVKLALPSSPMTVRIHALMYEYTEKYTRRRAAVRALTHRVL